MRRRAMSAAWTFPHCIVLTKVMDQKLAEDIHNSIYGLNQLLHEAGIKDICRILERILQSPDEISALYNAFSSRLKDLSKKRRADTSFIHRCDWFRNFASQDGTRLDPKEINALAKITSCWELSDEQIEVLSACSIMWSKSPELFWYGESADDNLIRRCYNDLRTMEDVDPLRRRIVLMILAQHVEQEQNSLRTKGQRARSRPRNRKVSEGRSRKRVLLPSAVRSLTKDLWPQLQPEKQNHIKKRLATDSLYGWKWRQVDRAEMVLSLQSAGTKRFERHSWSQIELEAMNQFVETLPQCRIQSFLRDAMKSIVSYYSKSMGFNRPCRESPVNRSQSPLGIIPTTTPTSHSLSAMGESTNERTSEGCSPAHSIREQPVARIESPEALENIRYPSVDNPRQSLASDVSVSDHPHPQTNIMHWNSRARSGVMDMHQSHGLEEIVNICQNRSQVDQSKGGQYQVAGSQVIFGTDSSSGEALENGSCLSRFNLHSIDALYDPRANAQLIGPEYSSVSDVQQLDCLYDPRLNMQQIDSLYDPRLNMQQIDSFYDPRLNMQQIDSLYDPRFNLQPIADTPFAIQRDLVDSFGSNMQHVTSVIGVQNEGQIVNQPSSQSTAASAPSFHASILPSNFSSTDVSFSQVPECSA